MWPKSCEQLPLVLVAAGAAGFVCGAIGSVIVATLAHSSSASSSSSALSLLEGQTVYKVVVKVPAFTQAVHVCTIHAVDASTVRISGWFMHADSGTYFPVGYSSTDPAGGSSVCSVEMQTLATADKPQQNIQARNTTSQDMELALSVAYTDA